MSNTYNKEEALDAAIDLRSQGKTNTEISKILGIPRTTIYDWLGGSIKKIVTTEEIIDDENGIVYDNVYTNVYNNVQSEKSDILKFLEELAPVHYPAPVRSGVKKEGTDNAMIIGDMHFGMEDWNTLNIFLETVCLLKPKKIILNGDTLDMFAISKYPKDARHKQTLKHEKEQYHYFLKQLHDVVVDWDCEIFETNANHSGNSQEGRLWRYLSQRIPEFACMEEVQKALSYENIFFPDPSWNRVKLVDEVILPTNFIVRHGTVVRKNGGMSARGEFEKHYVSTLTNHTHRLGSTMQRQPAMGNRPEEVYTNYENGCACDLNPDYAVGANWQNGFSIVNYSEDVVGVEQVLVNGNKATICSLGRTLRA